MKRILLFSGSLVLVLLLSGCNLFNSPTTPPINTPANNNVNQPDNANIPTNNPVNEPEPEPEPTPTATVSMNALVFSPSTLTVKKGTKVTWVNNDSVLHKVNANLFNSASLSLGQSYSYTFNATGTFDYTCSLHPGMNGTIIVE